MEFGEIAADRAEGAILAHSVKHAGGVFKKGRVLTAADVATLTDAGIARVFAARLGADDVPEDAAAAAVARLIAARGPPPRRLSPDAQIFMPRLAGW